MLYFDLMMNVIAVLFFCGVIILVELSIKRKYADYLLGIIFGLITVIIMNEKIMIGQDHLFDFRHITMTLAGFIGGPVTAVIAAIISSIYRYNLGGSGWIGGITNIVIFGCLGSLLGKYLRKRQDGKKYLFWLITGLMMAVVLLLIIAYIPPGKDDSETVLRTVAGPFLIFTPLATTLIFNFYYWAHGFFSKASILNTIIKYSPLNLIIFDSNGPILLSDNLKKQHQLSQFIENTSHLLDSDKELLNETQQHREIVTYDGSYFDCYLSNFQMLSGHRACVMMLNDITDKKMDEEQLRLADERFTKAFYGSPNLQSIVRDSDLTYIEVNQRFLDNLELKRDNVIGQTDAILGVSEEVRQNVWSKINEYGEINNFEMQLESGSILLISAVPITMNGERCHLFSYNDITELKKIQVEVSRLDRLDLVGQMAAGIGHEIRNPMTTVRGYLQLLGAKPEYSLQRSTFELMISELDRANSIITEFLALAKTRPTTLDNKNLNDIINKLYPLIQADAINKNKQISFYPMDLLNSDLDEKEISQLILNLTRNGLESMQENGLLTLETYMEGNNVVLKVEDEGCGIPPENLDKLGRPFFTTKESGTGLGLATSYRIVGSHNGKIDVDSSNKGTTFYVRFPMCKAEELDVAHGLKLSSMDRVG